MNCFHIGTILLELDLEQGWPTPNNWEEDERGKEAGTILLNLDGFPKYVKSSIKFRMKIVSMLTTKNCSIRFMISV